MSEMKRPYFYVLDGHKPVAVDDITKWSFDKRDRIVKQEHVGDFFVSTVFLGIDHRHFGEGPPILFETMIFGDNEKYQERYCTWEEAEEGHKLAVKKAKEYVKRIKTKTA